jgi:DNA ligase D-like protein (predicted 3'-phosphoesterase)
LTDRFPSGAIDPVNDTDRRLDSYRSKRRVGHTPEPMPGSKRGNAEHPSFVIQEHHASRLHWDFRLEIDDVLVSWAVPKGPSTDPRDKRLAVRTEDHPLEYGEFEGVIPRNEYGGGVVIVWDRGTYRNLRADEDPPRSMAESLDAGQIEVSLDGHKLRGGFALVHAKLGGRDDNWLLIKKKDDHADARRNPTSTEPKSVVSGRTVDEVAEAEGTS